MDQKEVLHTISVLKQTKDALINENSLKLAELSNQKIHSAICIQDIESINLTIVIYSLAKIVERKNNLKIKKWSLFIKKIISSINQAITTLKENKQELYSNAILKTKSIIELISPDLKEYTKEIIRNACINKGSHIYKHGISLGKTAQLLGISEWELSEFTGQSRIADINYNKTLNEKKRAQLALEFFS